MVFVLTPIYDYDEQKELYEFNSIDEALSFIDEHLKLNQEAHFHNGPEDYIVVEGKKIKIKAIKYASKVIVD